MKTMYTNKHKIPFFIDDEDEERVSKHKWYISSIGYVTHSIYGMNEFLTEFLMGRIAPYGFVWDHKDRNKMNNQKENIRLVTFIVSARNRGLRQNNLTKYKGIEIYPKGFVVRLIHSNGTYRSNHKTLEEAIAARKAAEDKYWGNER